MKLCLVLVAFLISCSSASINAQHTPESKPYEVVQVTSLDSTTLRGHLYKPKGAGPFPAIVALHGCAGLFKKGDEANPRDVAWGSQLAQWGYVVLYPDSFTTRGIDEICTKSDRGDMVITTRPQDAYGALKWLQNQSFVKADQIAIMGWSNGGSTLLNAVRKNSAYLDTTKPDFKTAIAFYPGCVKVNKDTNWANRIPVTILMGEKDNWTLPEACKSLVEKMKGAMTITLYPDSYHDFDSPNMPLRQKHNLPLVAGNNHTATLGTNEEARKKAFQRVSEILKETFSN